MGDSFLDLMDENLDDAKEPQAVEDGEYTIRLADWKTNSKGSPILKDKNDNPYMMPMFEVINCEEAEYAKQFSQFLAIPNADMDKKRRNGAKWELKCFFQAFGQEYSSKVDLEGMIGMTADALLVVTPDTGYGEQNKVKRFIAGR